MRELFTPGQPPDDDTRKKMDDVRKNSGEKLLAVLSPEQKAKWTELQGEPFKGEIRVGPPRQQLLLSELGRTICIRGGIGLWEGGWSILRISI